MKINAYVLAGDPAWATASLSSYYPFVDKVVVAFDRDHRSWSGDPLNVSGALEALQEADPEHKISLLPGNFSDPSRPRLDLETVQRQVALDRASEGCDWVLQLDTDEIILDQDSFLAQLGHADTDSYDALHYPLRDFYQAIGSQLYLEHSSRLWGARANYPGPVAVRANTKLHHCRQAKVSTYRVDFAPRNTDPWHPAEAPVHAVIPTSGAIAHMSWVRTSREMRSKSKVDGHAAARDWPQELRSWHFRRRHPVLTVLTNALRRKNTDWFKLSVVEVSRPLANQSREGAPVLPMPAEMRQPAVDIVLATNRDSPFLEEALRSVRNQTFKNWHLTVVDDGSPNSSKLQHLVGENVPGATLLRQPNRGPGAARNAGIHHGRAPLITFIDDDDVWHPKRLEVLVATLLSRPHAIGAHSSAKVIDSQGLPLPSRGVVDGVAEDMLRGRTPIPFFGTVLCTRKGIVRAGGFTESVATAEDNGLLLDLLQQGSFVSTKGELLIYRRHSVNLTNASWPNIRGSALMMLEEKIDDAAARGDVRAERMLRENRSHYSRRALVQERRWFRLQLHGRRAGEMTRSAQQMVSLFSDAYMCSPWEGLRRLYRDIKSGAEGRS